MDRNMITVMSGQVVDFYDNDFRELYAISDKLDLFKEFHLSKPKTGTLSRASVPKRPLAATSRFQVNLGDATRGDIKVPAHKYHNPKYLLALGQIPGPTTPLQEFLSTMQPPDPTEQLENPMEELENLTPVPSQTGKKESKKLKTPSKRSWWRKQKKDKTSEAVIEENTPDEAPKHTPTADETSEAQDSSKKKKSIFRNIFKKNK